MSTLFFHRANDYTGSTRALATVIETEYGTKDVYIVTTDVNRAGFLTSLSNVTIKKVCYPTIKGERIKVLSYLVSTFHTFWIALTFGFRFDTFYINTINPYQAALVGRFLKKNIIYHVHEKLIDNGREQRFLERIFNGTQAKRFYVSNYVMGQYPGTSNSFVKYNKLPGSFLSLVTPTRIEERKRCNIIMISALSVAKGVFNFIALANLLPQYSFTLIVNANEDEIRSFVKIDSPSNLLLIPAQSNIHPFLKEADLILNLTIPSLAIETFGLTIIEAMAYGIPAIVPNVGGPPELVVDGYNGYCVDVTKIEEVSAKIKEILTTPTYTSMATHAMERVKLFIVTTTT
jgi:glycosyltransferase involved in cell wall biosynthesis